MFNFDFLRRLDPQIADLFKRILMAVLFGTQGADKKYLVRALAALDSDGDGIPDKIDPSPHVPERVVTQETDARTPPERVTVGGTALDVESIVTGLSALAANDPNVRARVLAALGVYGVS